MWQNPVVKDLVVTAALAVAALMAVWGAGYIVTGGVDGSALSQQLRRDEIRTIQNREIVDYEYVEDGGNERVFYTYVGEPLPEKLAENEVPQLRRADAWTKQTGTAPDGRAIYESVVYPAPQYVERSGRWYHLEYGNTTREIFDRARNPFFFSEGAKEAHALSAAPFVLRGDGNVGVSTTSWANARTATSGNLFPILGSPYLYEGSMGAIIDIRVSSFHHTNAGKTDFLGTGYYIYRGFFPFDTSFIPYGSTISAASFTAYATSTKVNTDNDGFDYITLVESTQRSPYNLSYNDFGRVNSTEGVDAGQRKDITSITVGTALTWTLNATGRGFVKTNGQLSSCGTSTQYTILDNGSTWTVPYNWDSSNNSIEVIGAGGGGGTAVSSVGGGGAGGGAYSKVTNVSLTPGSEVTFSAGAPGTAGLAGGDTYFCNSTSNCASIAGSAVVVGAKGGSGASGNTGGSGGSAGSGVGSTKYSGGAGANAAGRGGAGAGGAGGPNGDGANGGSASGTGGGGGGGASGGSAGSASISGNGAAGGNNHLSAGGGTGGTGGATPTSGAFGADGGGGGGGGGGTNGFAGNGGASSNTVWIFDIYKYGPGGGGGGGGGDTLSNGIGGTGGGGFLGTVTGHGGGGGGGGWGGSTQGGGGGGGPGVIIITHTTDQYGKTCLSLREGHDFANNTPVNDTENSAYFTSSEHPGTANDPYLSITYTAPFAFWQFFDF